MTARSPAGEVDAIRHLLGAKPRPVGWAARRERIEEVGSHWPPDADIAFESVGIADRPAEWSLAPGSDAACVLLFFHGGGYCSGSLKSHRSLVGEAGRAARLRTLALEYRLAPEHPFPAALDDAEQAWRFLRGQGYAANRIAVGGDSAGGGLTLALVQRLRAQGEALPGFLWLLSPWTDLTLSGATLASKDAVDPLIHKGYLAELATAYLAGHDAKNPLVSPLFAELAGLPPTLIQVGSAETLLSDATRLAEALGAASVPVTLEVWPEMIHAFVLWNAALSSGRLALASAGRAMRAALA
jgi:acetyl esterase/lipase